MKPSSFLSKYQKPSTRQPSKHEIQETQTEPDALSPTLSGDGFQTPPERLSPVSSPTRQVLKIPEQFDLDIKWKVADDNPIFDDGKTASDRARQYFAQKDTFWDHPVRCLEYAEKNLFRTVMIDYIPLTASYEDVLEQIYGGSIEKITLVGPLGNTVNYRTARVVFNFELGAATTADYAREHGMIVKGCPVRVWHVPNQTYPKNKKLEKDVFENGYTRVLLFDNITDDQLALIPGKLAWAENNIVDIGRAADGMPMVEFTDVAVASKALELFMNDPEFGAVRFDFEDDPCAAPYPAVDS